MHTQRRVAQAQQDQVRPGESMPMGLSRRAERIPPAKLASAALASSSTAVTGSPSVYPNQELTGGYTGRLRAGALRTVKATAPRGGSGTPCQLKSMAY
jgi:hypothetical protein